MAISFPIDQIRPQRISVIATCLFLAMALSGCLSMPKADSPETSELTIYTNLDEGPFNTYIADFTSQYPDVQINAVRRSTGEIASRLIAEQDDPQADVVWGVSATVQNLLEWNDLLEPYAPAGLERVPSNFRDTSTPPYWVGIGASMSALCVNTVRLTDLGLPMPESWAELVDPIYKDQVAMPSPVTSGTGYLIVEGWLEIDGESKGWEYLDALNENIRLYTQGSSTSCTMAAAGEIAIGIANDQIVVEAAAANPSMAVVFPSEGSGWDMEANALVKKDVISPASLLFLDWAISDSAMKAYAKDRAILAVPPKDFQPPPGFPPEPLKQLMDKDFPWASANRDRIIAEWLARYQEKLETE